MGETPPWRAEPGPTPPRLLAWCLSTFHVSALVLVAVLALHATGRVGDVLAGLDTGVGLALFAVLWLLVVVTNRQVLAAIPRDSAGTPVGAWDPAIAGAVWGAVTGIAVVALPLLFFAVVTVLSNPASAALVLALGVVVASVVGASIGLAFALLDVALLAVARRLVPATTLEERAERPVDERGSSEE